MFKEKFKKSSGTYSIIIKNPPERIENKIASEISKLPNFSATQALRSSDNVAMVLYNQQSQDYEVLEQLLNSFNVNYLRLPLNRTAVEREPEMFPKDTLIRVHDYSEGLLISNTIEFDKYPECHPMNQLEILRKKYPDILTKAPVDIYGLCSRENIIIYEVEPGITQSALGLSVSFPPLRFEFILVNNKLSMEEKREKIGHEVGQLLTWRCYTEKKQGLDS